MYLLVSPRKSGTMSILPTIVPLTCPYHRNNKYLVNKLSLINRLINLILIQTFIYVCNYVVHIKIYVK